MAKYILTLVYFFCLLNVRGQEQSFSTEKKFLIHLDSIGGKNQKKAYLEYLIRENKYPDNDTLTLETGFTDFENLKYEKAVQTFRSVKGFKADQKFRIIYGNTLLNTKRYQEFDSVFSSWPESTDTTILIQKLSSHVLAGSGNDSALKLLRNYLSLTVSDKHLKKKSPALAGAYSAIIPGMGKLYCGKKNQFVTSLIANLALGLQTWEAASKDGTNSARFIVTGILFSFTYFGNIWGSVLTAKNYRSENYRQLEYEILDYNNVISVQPQ